jgi:hypothetical protein
MNFGFLIDHSCLNEPNVCLWSALYISVVRDILDA